MAGLGCIGAVPVGAGDCPLFALRVRQWRARAVFDKNLALGAVFDKAAHVAVTTDPEE